MESSRERRHHAACFQGQHRRHGGEGVVIGGSRRAAVGLAALLMVMVLVVLSAGTASARRPHPPGGSTPPRAGTGPFAGISAWGTGAPACDRVQGPTVLRFFCHGILRNFIGSYVLIRFPNRTSTRSFSSDHVVRLQARRHPRVRERHAYWGLRCATTRGTSVLRIIRFRAKVHESSTPKSPSPLAKPRSRAHTE